MAERVYFLDQTVSILNVVGVSVIEITLPICIAVLSAWWADSPIID
jgi:hypothetical protein